MTTAILPHQAADHLLKLRRSRHDLIAFSQYTMPGYMAPPHLVRLADRLEAIDRGELKRLMVFIPPRHGKSEQVSVRFPCWYLGRHPEAQIVLAGYAESIALVHSRSARTVFNDRAMARVFPGVRERTGPKTERQAAQEWETTQGGKYYAVGVGGGLTGRGFNIGIIDDPVKDAEEAASAVARQRVWEWWTQVFLPRSEPEAAIILVMTRWHADDLGGRLLKQMAQGGEQWEVLHLPALDEDGHALWPERFPAEVLQTRLAALGTRAFTALYQGDPVVATGNIIKREWARYYDGTPAVDRIIHSWDTAFKKKQSNDPSAGEVWGVAGNGYYLLDVVNERMEFPELKRLTQAMWERDHAEAVLVEDAASGQSLVQELQRETRMPILPQKVLGDKEARVNSIAPLWEAGRVFLPRSAPWLFDFLDQVCGFPAAPHDDMVDAMTQALRYLTDAGEQEVEVVYDTMAALGMDIDL